MPGRITGRAFKTKAHKPPWNLLSKRKPKTNLDPGDVFGTGNQDKTMNQRQEGLNTGLQSQL